MVEVILSLGGNLGDRASCMRQMEREVERLLKPPVAKSSLMETEPIGVASKQEWFYNRLVRGGYAGTSRELLKACHAIEARLGRTRPERYAARTADIDILLFGDDVINEPDLVVPHPGIQKRRFCILGLKEVAGPLMFPGSGKQIAALAGEWEQGVAGQKVSVVREYGF
jgi:2-amino-4-hydroxy-6-hydroxymethyldihydropteridine diphosphokinase